MSEARTPTMSLRFVRVLKPDGRTIKVLQQLFETSNGREWLSVPLWEPLYEDQGSDTK